MVEIIHSFESIKFYVQDIKDIYQNEGIHPSYSQYDFIKVDRKTKFS